MDEMGGIFVWTAIELKVCQTATDLPFHHYPRTKTLTISQFFWIQTGDLAGSETDLGLGLGGKIKVPILRTSFAFVV